MRAADCKVFAQKRAFAPFGQSRNAPRGVHFYNTGSCPLFSPRARARWATTGSESWWTYPPRTRWMASLPFPARTITAPPGPPESPAPPPVRSNWMVTRAGPPWAAAWARRPAMSAGSSKSEVIGGEEDPVGVFAAHLAHALIRWGAASGDPRDHGDGRAGMVPLQVCQQGLGAGPVVHAVHQHVDAAALVPVHAAGDLQSVRAAAICSCSAPQHTPPRRWRPGRFRC